MAQQMEVKMESLSNAVEKDEIKLHSGNQAKESTFDGDASKDDYIHVRAKRGQATNSHSLAERVRLYSTKTMICSYFLLLSFLA